MSEASLFELDLYMKITAAWYESQPREPHIDGALRPYLLGTGFAQSIQESSWRLDHEHIAAICARLVSSETWQLDGLRKVLDTQSIGRAPKHFLDHVNAWWYPLEKADILGIHYWQLANGTLELRLLHKFDKAPPLLFGRFARSRDSHATNHRRRGSR